MYFEVLLALAILAVAASQPFTEHSEIPGLSDLHSLSNDQDQPPPSTSTDADSPLPFVEFLEALFNTQDQGIGPGLSSTLIVKPDRQEFNEVLLQATSPGTLDLTFEVTTNPSSEHDLLILVQSDSSTSTHPTDEALDSSTSESIFKTTINKTSNGTPKIVSTNDGNATSESPTFEPPEYGSSTPVQVLTSVSGEPTPESTHSTTDDLSFVATEFILEQETLIPKDDMIVASTSQTTFEVTDSSFAQETKMTSTTHDSTTDAELTLETKDSVIETAAEALFKIQGQEIEPGLSSTPHAEPDEQDFDEVLLQAAPTGTFDTTFEGKDPSSESDSPILGQIESSTHPTDEALDSTSEYIFDSTINNTSGTHTSVPIDEGYTSSEGPTFETPDFGSTQDPVLKIVSGESTPESTYSTTDNLSFETTDFTLIPEALIPVDDMQVALASQTTFEVTDSSFAQESDMSSSTPDSTSNAENTTEDSDLEIASTTENELNYELEAKEFTTEAATTVQTLSSTNEPTETSSVVIPETQMTDLKIGSSNHPASETLMPPTSSNYLDIVPKEVKLPDDLTADRREVLTATTKIPETTTPEKYLHEKLPTLFFVILAFLILPVVNTVSRFVQLEALKAFFGCCMQSMISSVSLVLLLVMLLLDREESRFLVTVLWTIPGRVWIICTFLSIVMGLVIFCGIARFQTILQFSTYSADLALISACVLKFKYDLFLEIKPLIGFQVPEFCFLLWIWTYIIFNEFVILNRLYGPKELDPRPRRAPPTNATDPADPEQPCDAQEEQAVVNQVRSTEVLKSDQPEVHSFVGGDQPVVTSAVSHTTIQIECDTQEEEAGANEISNTESLKSDIAGVHSFVRVGDQTTVTSTPSCTTIQIEEE